MEKISGGHLVARALKTEGVEAIFTLCGGHIIDVYDGCLDEGIRIIDVRHEQSAAHAADAWTRITGKPGVAVVTAGPGTTDTVTAVANAFRAQTPMLVIGGQGASTQIHMGSLQELDHVGIMKPITKFATTVPHTQRIPELLSIAFREAYSGRPGPSFLEIPRDVLDAQVDVASVRFPQHYRSHYRVHGDPQAIALAASWVQQAERVAVLAGSQVQFCRGAEALQRFAEQARLPIYVNGAARGALPPTHANLFVRSRRKALAEAEVIFILGTPFDFRLGYGQRLNPAAKVIQVDLEYGELGHNRDVDLGICGDAAAVLEQLTDAIGRRGKVTDGWLQTLREAEEKGAGQAAAGLNSDQIPIHPLRLCKEINEFLTPDTIFIGDGGDIVTMCASVIRTHKPGHWLDPGPLGTLGVGAPFAIAAKTALPDKEVFVLFGDGAFGLTGFDIDTAVRFDLPFVSVVGNNAGWNQIRYGQLAKYGEKRGDIANKLRDTRYDLIVEAMGGYGELVTQPADIRPALERARASGKPSCVNVMLDPDIYSSGTMNQTMYK